MSVNKYADYKSLLKRPSRRSDPQFEILVDEWWDKKSRELALGTFKCYKPCIARAVDAFGSCRMKDIEPRDIADLLQAMKESGFSAKVVLNQHAVLNMIFDFYIEEYGGTVNASRMVQTPRNAKRTRRTRPTPYQRAQLETQVSDSGGGLFLGFLLYTSCRKGEILALQYQDIDLDARRISITKSVTYMGNAPIVGETKTENGVRVNPILEPFYPVLASAMAHPHKPVDYIFGGAQPITDSAARTMWVHLLEPLGLTTLVDGATWKYPRRGKRRALVTPHQLRHEYAYSLFKAGVPELVAKTLMGHADISTTHNIYTELGAEDIDQSAALLNGYFSARRGQREAV